MNYFDEWFNNGPVAAPTANCFPVPLFKKSSLINGHLFSICAGNFKSGKQEQEEVLFLFAVLNYQLFTAMIFKSIFLNLFAFKIYNVGLRKSKTADLRYDW